MGFCRGFGSCSPVVKQGCCRVFRIVEGAVVGLAKIYELHRECKNRGVLHRVLLERFQVSEFFGGG